MTLDEIRNALCTNNTPIIDELFLLVKILRSEEIDRTKAIDTKAASIFGFIGLFGSALALGLTDNLDRPFSSFLHSSIGLWPMAVALCLLVLSLTFIYFSVRVSAAHSAPGAPDLFHIIKEYDEPDPDRKNVVDAHRYKRYLIEHYWQLYQAIFSKNELKAKHLKSAQRSIFTALLIIVVLQLFSVVSEATMPNQNSENTQTTTTQSTGSDQQVTPPVVPRPAPTAQSTAGTLVTESNNRPTPTRASSPGEQIRLGRGHGDQSNSNGGQ